MIRNFHINQKILHKSSQSTSHYTFSCFSCLTQNCLFQKFYGNDEEAIEVVRHGNAWGTISFAHNYTDSLAERTDFGHNVEDYVIDGADLTVHLDMSSKQFPYSQYGSK